MYKPTFHYLFDFKVILGPDINKLSDIYYRCEETWAKLNFIFLRFFEWLNIITRTVCDTKRKDTITAAYLHIGYDIGYSWYRIFVKEKIKKIILTAPHKYFPCARELLWKVNKPQFQYTILYCIEMWRNV